MQEGVLVLKSGEVFEGWLHGAGGSSQGEEIFNFVNSLEVNQIQSSRCGLAVSFWFFMCFYLIVFVL